MKNMESCKWFGFFFLTWLYFFFFFFISPRIWSSEVDRNCLNLYSGSFVNVCAHRFCLCLPVRERERMRRRRTQERSAQRPKQLKNNSMVLYRQSSATCTEWLVHIIFVYFKLWILFISFFHFSFHRFLFMALMSFSKPQSPLWK